MMGVLRRAWPVLIIALLWTLFFWRILTPVAADRLTFQQGDFTLQFLAYRQMALRQFAAGHLPVIEECLYAGHPFQADPQAQVLYPPVLATMLIGRGLGWQTYPLRALEWEVMLHVLLAALAMYAFLRCMPRAGGGGRGMARSAALFGALAYGFGGFMTGYAMLQTAILETAAWLPLILLATGWLVRARRWLPSAAALAVLVYCAFTAGHPQTLLFTVYAGTLAFVWWAWHTPQPETEVSTDVRQSRLHMVLNRLRLGRAMVAGAFAIGLSAVQLIPTLSFMLASTRASLTFEQAGGGFVLHDIALFAFTGVSSVWQPVYVGITALAFAGVAIVTALRSNRSKMLARARTHMRTALAGRDTWLWVVLGIGALVLGFGANAVGFDLAYLTAPGYRQFQSQERHAVIVSFAVCVLAAQGMHWLAGPLRLRARAGLGRSARWPALGSGLAFAILVAVIAYARITSRDDLGLVSDRLSILALGLLGTAALLAWRARIGTGTRAVWLGAALALLVFDLFSVNRYTATQNVSEPFPALPLAKPVQDSQPSDAPSTTRLYNHFGLPLNGACVRGINEVGGGSPIILRDYKALIDQTPEDVMVKLLNVRYATTWRGAMTTPEGRTIPWFLLARDTFEGKPASTFRLDWEPRNSTGAWIAKNVIVQPVSDQILNAMHVGGFDPFVTAFVSSPMPIHASQGSAALEGKATGYIKIAANVDAPALLVVSEAYHWNWIARVNGVEVKPVVADMALIGVPLPAGASSVELSFRPLDLYVGAGVSFLTVLVMLGADIVSRRRLFCKGDNSWWSLYSGC